MKYMMITSFYNISGTALRIKETKIISKKVSKLASGFEEYMWDAPVYLEIQESSEEICF